MTNELSADGCGCTEDDLCDYHWGVQFGRSLLEDESDVR